MVSSGQISQYTKGIFPAAKKDLLRRVKTHSAPKEVIDAIEKLPDGQFESMTDVIKAVGNLK